MNKIFPDVCDWFVDNKLIVYFREDKAKCILFDIKHKPNKVGSFDFRYGEIHIKQTHRVTYLGSLLDETQWL